jgi:hypothetical protein
VNINLTGFGVQKQASLVAFHASLAFDVTRTSVVEKIASIGDRIANSSNFHHYPQGLSVAPVHVAP